jgi:hypothetical protein
VDKLPLEEVALDGLPVDELPLEEAAMDWLPMDKLPQDKAAKDELRGWLQAGLAMVAMLCLARQVDWSWATSPMTVPTLLTG